MGKYGKNLTFYETFAVKQSCLEKRKLKSKLGEIFRNSLKKKAISNLIYHQFVVGDTHLKMNFVITFYT